MLSESKTEKTVRSLPVVGVVRWVEGGAEPGEVNVVLSGGPEPSPKKGVPLPVGQS